MVQGQSGRISAAAPIAPGNEVFVFDLKNGLRVWLSEAVKRGQVSASEAETAVRNMDLNKARDVTEDQFKLWLGPIKDSFGSVGIGKKLVGDFGRWWNVKVYFKEGTNGQIVIIKGWPAGRKLLSGTRYRVDNVKIMELQIGKPGIEAAAKESARFGIYLVVAVDLFQFTQDRNFAHLLGSLTVDLPSVLLASAIGGAVGTALTGVTTGALAIGAFALGPALVAFGVGVLVGAGLFWLDKQFGLTDKVSEAYARGLDKLERWWHEAGAEAGKEWQRFQRSWVVHDLQRGFEAIGKRLGESNNSLVMLQSLM